MDKNKISNVFGSKRFNFESVEFSICGITLEDAKEYFKTLRGSITETLLINGNVEQFFVIGRA